MRMPLQQPATSLKADILGGLTTFVTMASIVVVNPGILATPGTGIPFFGALTATVLVAFSMTLLMGLYPRLPFAVAPVMGHGHARPPRAFRPPCCVTAARGRRRRGAAATRWPFAARSHR